MLKDKWSLEALLGVGGMAAVYMASHRNNGKRVAVKMLHPELSVISQIKTRFLREGYASNKVNHPGVVSVLDDDATEDGCVYLVMELLEGENLEQRRVAAGGRLDLQEVLWIVDQLLDVLAAAHTAGIIHRDIKPENLFLTRGAALKVLDFGLARVRDPKSPTSAGLTRTNMLMGTLDFMPPEQARGKWDGVGAQADIWSVGASMFMLLTGRPVHEEPTMDGQIKAVTTRPPRSIRSLRPDLPASVVALVDRALAFLPRDRWADAFSMQEAVRDAYNRLGGEQVPTTLRPPPVETPTEAGIPVATPSWDTDLAQTRALSKVRFDEDDVTRALPPSLPLADFLDRALAAPSPRPQPAHPATPPSGPLATPPSGPPAASPLAPAATTSSGPSATPAGPPAPPRIPSTPSAEPPPQTTSVPSVDSPPRVPSTPSADLAHRAPSGPSTGSNATPGPMMSSDLAAPVAGGSPGAPTAGAMPPWKRRQVLLIVASLPLWLLLFWGLASLRSCGAPPEAPAMAPEPSASAAASAEPPAPSASAAASAEAPPAPSASASVKKPGKPPPRKVWHRKK